MVYSMGVIITALGLFLPILYGNVGPLRELLGNDPLLKSLAITLFGWLMAYITFEDDGKIEELRVF